MWQAGPCYTGTLPCVSARWSAIVRVGDGDVHHIPSLHLILSHPIASHLIAYRVIDPTPHAPALVYSTLPIPISYHAMNCLTRRHSIATPRVSARAISTAHPRRAHSVASARKASSSKQYHIGSNESPSTAKGHLTFCAPWHPHSVSIPGVQ